MHTPRAMLERILTEAGHEVVGTAGNGQEALELVRVLKPEAVVFDISMPVMMGDIAANAVHAMYPHVMIFMATNLGLTAVRTQLESIGAFFIIKPYFKEKVTHAINAALKGQRVV